MVEKAARERGISLSEFGRIAILDALSHSDDTPMTLVVSGTEDHDQPHHLGTHHRGHDGPSVRERVCEDAECKSLKDRQHTPHQPLRWGWR